MTVGPSDTAASGVSLVGKAAHITAAAPRGPRYEASLSEQERKAYENGVWLCSTHADQVDNDAERFPRELLVAWRTAAEEWALEAQGRNRPALENRRALVSVERRLEVEINQVPAAVQRFLWDVGAEQAWGDMYDLARVALSELALNAALHGGVRTIGLRAGNGTIIVTDAGPAFGLGDLLAGGYGGHQAISALRRHGDGRMTLAYRRVDGQNEWVFVDESYRGGVGNPCAARVPVSRDEMKAGTWVVSTRLRGCEEIHVYLPDHFILSDVRHVIGAIRRHQPDTPICLHNFSFGAYVGNWLMEMGVRCA